MESHEQSRIIKESVSCMEQQEIVNSTIEINHFLYFQIMLVFYYTKEELAEQLTKFVMSLINERRKDFLEFTINIISKYILDGTKWDMDFDSLEVYVVPKSQTSIMAMRSHIDLEQAEFKDDSFFEVISTLSCLKLTPKASKFSRVFRFVLSKSEQELMSQVAIDGFLLYEIRFFCSTIDASQKLKGAMEVRFPEHCNISVNNNIVDPTLYKIKKSRREVSPNITYMIKKKDVNTVTFFCSNTLCFYVSGVCIVKRRPIPELMKEIKQQIVPKKKILNELKRGLVEHEEQNLLLKCPLTLQRIEWPVRSFNCTHIQCFDAAAFLIMNLQYPTWICPICDKPIESYRSLIVDAFSLEIIHRTSVNTNYVAVKSCGQVLYFDNTSSKNTYDLIADSNLNSNKREKGVIEPSKAYERPQTKGNYQIGFNRSSCIHLTDYTERKKKGKVAQ
ncbi:MIZ/SP-RING zinc finger-domain-containing protein [Sporodiniella umbellata]|nr:MIZ/SP-RING zinc finger-domain-containing protein [Sporodiniella umbellata]